MGRKERVESALREVLAELISREVKDPRVQAVGMLGVSKVECTPDLSVAKVWISIYADDAVADKALKGLQTAAGFLRGPVGRRLNLVHTPELRFARDITSEMAIKLRTIVQEDEAKAKAAGRELVDPAHVVPADKPAAVEPDAEADEADAAAAASVTGAGTAPTPD